MSIWAHQFINRLLLIFSSVFFAITLLSTFYFKQLFNESIWHLFVILNEKNYTFQRPEFFRLSIEVIKAPANIATFIGLPPYFIIWIFCFCLAAYPLAVFLLLQKIYKNTKVIQFLPAFIVVFFLAMTPSWMFSVAVTGDCIVLSSALFCYILGRNQIVWWKLALLCIPILFSYEAGLIFFILAFYFLIRENKFTWQSGLTLAIFFLLQACHLLFYLIPNNHHHTLNDGFEVLKSPDFWWLIPSILVCTADFFESKFIRQTVFMISLIIIGINIYQTTQISIGSLPYIAHANRVWAIPAAFVILFVLYEVFRKHGGRFRITSLAIFCVLTVPGIIVETRYLFAQKELLTNLRTVILSKPGCHVLNSSEFQKLVGRSNPARWDFFHLSVLLNYSLKPNTVLFVEQTTGDPTERILENTFCKLDADGLISIQSNTEQYRTRVDQNIDFSNVITSSK